MDSQCQRTDAEKTCQKNCVTVCHTKETVRHSESLFLQFCHALQNSVKLEYR